MLVVGRGAGKERGSLVSSRNLTPAATSLLRARRGVIALEAGLPIIACRMPYGGRNKGNLVRRVKSFIYITAAATNDIVLVYVSI